MMLMKQNFIILVVLMFEHCIIRLSVFVMEIYSSYWPMNLKLIAFVLFHIQFKL
jgi:hypothetical protein